ncbi:MAG: hypothetical protein HPY50_11385 [Firmicutes bacterium]|nr:hypothetical protein [Bacillota bacterium]
MNFLTRAFNEVFNFFCGDWRIFWGVAFSILLVWLIEHVQALAGFRAAAGIVLMVGVSLSLIVALRRETAG